VILLDTSVLSAVLRRGGPGAAEERLAGRLKSALSGSEKVGVPGLVVQELLSGVREERQVRRLKGILLSGYPVVIAALGDHLLAADIVNKCRRRGIAASSGDALIAALAINRKAKLFTADQDFVLIAKATPLSLLKE
jgi:predicted nucleic acid-binding protein